ncbi:unnamed protein product [Protopolystoma xenopodis]|uniref:Uncharacterized protein n=1 Tax=Protopolystoma xenopodis TaxID=117903 RepID=A0A448XA29_9PLAT|nr:unnamed protein product [Protopolystoma xenopodis]
MELSADARSNSTRTQFSTIWFKIFLCASISNMAVHGIAMILAFYNLRAHRLARIFAPLFILVMGFLNTITVLLITSLVIAGVYTATIMPFNDLHAILVGLFQTFLLFIFSISRLPATL